MWRAWRHAGVSIPRTAEGQRTGLPRVRGKLRPGDLVIYRTNGPSRRHVAMVVSKGRMVEAPARGVPVRRVALRAGWIAAVRPATTTAGPSRAARASIPPRYLALYRKAGAGQTWRTRDGRRYPAWAVLAGIGKIESDHGRSRAPGVRSGVNRFGCCAGPMQFNLRNGPPSTWDAYGHGSPYRAGNAIPAARRLLIANNAKRSLDSAIHNYNHELGLCRPGQGAGAPLQQGEAMTTVTLVNNDHVYRVVQVDSDGLDAAKEAKKTLATDTADPTWRVLKYRTEGA